MSEEPSTEILIEYLKRDGLRKSSPEFAPFFCEFQAAERLQSQQTEINKLKTEISKLQLALKDDLDIHTKHIERFKEEIKRSLTMHSHWVGVSDVDLIAAVAIVARKLNTPNAENATLKIELDKTGAESLKFEGEALLYKEALESLKCGKHDCYPDHLKHKCQECETNRIIDEALKDKETNV